VQDVRLKALTITGDFDQLVQLLDFVSHDDSPLAVQSADSASKMGCHRSLATGWTG
jgi:hypothetical protein